MSDTTSTHFYRSTLQQELARRCEKNARYSIRAFARALGFDSGALSQMLSGRRVPSTRAAQKLAEALDLAPEERNPFFASIAEAHRERDLVRRSPFLAGFAGQTSPPPRELSIDLFRVIADWHHAAILELSQTEAFTPDASRIAAALGISPAEARLALDRLIELGYLQWNEGEQGEKLERADPTFTTADKHLTTPALRRLQKQLLEKAIQSLENDPIEERSHTSMTMAIDPDLLPVARRLIDQFTQAVCAELETGRRRQVYQLAVALYPIQKKDITS